jgi:putative ABC transport system substrate-binding protein
MAIHIRRREFIFTLGGAAAAWPLAAHAQQPGKVHRIGILWASTPSANAPRMEAFRQGLRELGYVEGRNVVIAARGAPLSARSYIPLVDELIRERVDVILTAGTSPTRAAKNAAGAVPIVMTFVSDPIGSGFVASLARPGGNITGLTNFGPELSAKWLELLKELSPKASRIGILYNSAVRVLVSEIERTAKKLAVQLYPIEVNNALAEGSGPALESALAEFLKGHVEALIVILPPPNPDHREGVVDFATTNRLPTVYWWREYVEAGGLVYYGPSINEMYGRAAAFVDKILKGAKPSDLPVEQPTRFDLVVNLKTAKALGLDVPPSLLARADEVIE